MSFHLLIVIILFSLGNAADNCEVQTRVRPVSQADYALIGTLAEVDEKASAYVKEEEIAVQSTDGCNFVEVVNTKDYEFIEGVYEETSDTCDGKPIWKKMMAPDDRSFDYVYLYFTSSTRSWNIGPYRCQSVVYASATSSADKPGDATGWMESVYSYYLHSSTMRVTCKADAPCSRMYVTNVPSLHSEKEGEYQRDRVCTYRPAYRMGNNYLYYFMGTSFSGWVITSDNCTESTVSVSIRNLDNTGYPQDAVNTWQYYSDGWMDSSYLVVGCNAYAPYENGSARGIPHARVTSLAVMIAYCLGRCLIKE